MTPDWVKGRHPKRSVGPFQRASQKGATLSRCEEQELRASRNLASARNSRPSVKRRLLINGTCNPPVLATSKLGRDV